jgi:hypothetical protein
MAYNKTKQKHNMSKKDQTNKFNLKSFLQSKKGKYSLISALVLGVLLISGLFTSNLLKQNEVARAALNCPVGSTVNGAGTGCVSTTPSNYTCSTGSLGGDGTQCFVTGQTGTSYSCPNGGIVSGASCVGDISSPIQISTPGFVPGTAFCGAFNPIYGGLALCQIPEELGVIQQTLGPCPYQLNGFPSPGGGNIILVNGYWVCGEPSWDPSFAGTGTFNSVGYASNIVYSAQATYAATGTPIFGPVFTQNATPVFGTLVTPTSYTPDPGQVTGLTCTPTNPVVSTTVNCSGQGTGAPSGVPYAGSVTVSIDNGGGSIATTFNPDGTFTASNVPVGNTTGAKTATTNLGGTTPVNVVPAATTITSANISNSTDCTTTTNVVIGTTFNCTFPLTGDAGNNYALPTNGILANAATATGNSPACTITGNSTSNAALSCTSIPTTGGTPGNQNLGLLIDGSTTPVTKGAVNLVTEVDPDLASGPGSLSNSTDCTASTNVSIGTTYTCTFPINGTGPFVLPSGGIQARTNQSTNNSTPVSSCTISSSNLVCTGITTVGTPNPLTPGNGNVQLGKGTTPATWNNKGVINLTTASTLCSSTNPCALFDTALTYSPTQALAKRYGGSGSTTADNLILTLKDTRLEQPSYTTTCTFRYKFKSDTTWRSLSSSVAYNNSTGCTSTLLTADQLFWNVDFEITAVTTNGTTTKNYLLYNNYDFKAGSIGVTSIGGSGL